MPVRIMRVLCAMNVFEEKDVKVYAAARVAAAFRARPYLSDNVSTLFVLLPFLSPAAPTPLTAT